MKHLVRAGVLVVILVGALLVLRQIKVPAALEPFGFYSGTRAENAREWASKPLSYAAVPTCNECHQDKYGVWKESKHGTVSCENCHGPAQAHVDYGDPVVVDASRELCAVCHGKLDSRPKSFPQVDLSQHGRQLACITCHNPHSPQIAAPPAVPHDLQGRADCLVCHGQAGFKPAPKDHAGRVSDTCLSCHSAKK